MPSGRTAKWSTTRLQTMKSPFRRRADDPQAPSGPTELWTSHDTQVPTTVSGPSNRHCGKPAAYSLGETVAPAFDDDSPIRPRMQRRRSEPTGPETDRSVATRPRSTAIEQARAKGSRQHFPPNSLTSWNSRPRHPELPVIGYNQFHREARADAQSNSPVVVCYQSLDKLQRGLAEKKRALTNSPTDNRQLLLAPFFPCDFPHG